MSKFKIGDKVVPVSKSIMGPLKYSIAWRRAIKKKQPFLFVMKIEEDTFICNEDSTRVTGDFFLESDLLPFEEVQARIEPKEKHPIWYTLPAPGEEKIEPDYKGFYEFMTHDLDPDKECNVCKARIFCLENTVLMPCYNVQIAYAENKFIKRGEK